MTDHFIKEEEVFNNAMSLFLSQQKERIRGLGPSKSDVIRIWKVIKKKQEDKKAANEDKKADDPAVDSETKQDAATSNDSDDD